MRIHVDRTRVNFLSLESLFFVFKTPIIHSVCPLSPSKKNRINYCFQMFLGGLHILSIKNKGANLYGHLLGQAYFKISKLRNVTLVAAFYLRYFFRKINLS